MLQIAAISFTTFFATIGPIGVSAMFAAITSENTPGQRRSMAIRGTAVSAAILLVFALFGEALLGLLGISLQALKIAGGILLMIIGIDRVFDILPEKMSARAAESEEAIMKTDISVFPLATPFIAGPGAIGASILLMANTGGDAALKIAVISSMFAVLLITLGALLSASYLQKSLGVTGRHVISRIFGILLTALAVQFIIEGLAGSILFSPLQ